MEYVAYRRFKAEGIDGDFNLRYGTTVTERDGFLFAADGRKICAATSETDGSISDQTRRRARIVKDARRPLSLLRQARGRVGLRPGEMGGGGKSVLENLLRTMNTQELEEFYKKRLGELPKMEG